MTMWPFNRRAKAAATACGGQTGEEIAISNSPRGRPTIFTPTQPQQGAKGLVGRGAELARILQALSEDRSHVVIYSERGRGKTSLANATVDRLRQNGTVISRYSCEADSRFDDIIRGLVRGLPVGIVPGSNDDAVLPQRSLRPEDVVAILPGLACRALVCVVDEFDRVSDAATVTRIADTIKSLSDRGTPLQFVIVGVSENLEQLLAQHPSIQRNITAVQLRLLSNTEVGDLITAGMDRAGVTVAQDIVARLVLLARGSPHMAQVLGLRLVQAVTARAASSVSEQDVGWALDLLLSEASPQDAMTWDGLTAHGRSEEMVLALRRLATADQDVWGRVEVELLPNGGALVGGRSITAPVWNQIAAAEILRAAPFGSGLYVFRNRSTMHYILLLATRTLPRPHQSSASASVRLVAAGS